MEEASEINPIDNVTTTNLDMVLRMVGYQLDRQLIDKIIDMVELIEIKGDHVSLKDVSKLQAGWNDSLKIEITLKEK
jgi:hypothetical protein